MINKIKTSFLSNWVSIDEYDIALVQFYTFFFIWMQQLGI